MRWLDDGHESLVFPGPRRAGRPSHSMTKCLHELPPSGPAARVSAGRSSIADADRAACPTSTIPLPTWGGVRCVHGSSDCGMESEGPVGRSVCPAAS
ncbi:DUF1918 domain-containing protein [Nonomuraea turcica]|uniref:DUF1918 domain-containing protein n=1 Tax=Nonomuraea sp. G32 TaxID=3067274 RepID=UPI00273CB459|nr:DUF1918 domain-containing protein [Nonomuraea sp. G32]MDP4510018.1 DUF1918 domain-containing protein [Nonomuraea sp. G32]